MNRRTEAYIDTRIEQVVSRLIDARDSEDREDRYARRDRFELVIFIAVTGIGIVAFAVGLTMVAVNNLWTTDLPFAESVLIWAGFAWTIIGSAFLFTRALRKKYSLYY